MRVADLRDRADRRFDCADILALRRDFDVFTVKIDVFGQIPPFSLRILDNSGGDGCSRHACQRQDAGGVARRLAAQSIELHTRGQPRPDRCLDALVVVDDLQELYRVVCLERKCGDHLVILRIVAEVEVVPVDFLKIINQIIPYVGVGRDVKPCVVNVRSEVCHYPTSSSMLNAPYSLWIATRIASVRFSLSQTGSKDRIDSTCGVC